MSPAGMIAAGPGHLLTPFYIDPEVDMIYSGAAFNDQFMKFGPVVLVALARERADARRARKRRNRIRYQRMHDRRRRFPHPTKYTVVDEVIVDDRYVDPSP